jgi:hypothetical protein
VRDLIDLLIETKQELPSWLEGLAARPAGGGGGRGGGGGSFRGRFGGRDMRQNERGFKTYSGWGHHRDLPERRGGGGGDREDSWGRDDHY